jgi:hypothetical protein
MRLQLAAVGDEAALRDADDRRGSAGAPQILDCDHAIWLDVAVVDHEPASMPDETGSREPSLDRR